MNELIAKIKAKFAELRQQANEQLAKMKPLEQQEGAEQVGYIFRTARNIVEYLVEISTTLEGKVGELAEDFKTAARQELRIDEAFRQEVAKDPKVLDAVKAALLQSGELLTKTDHEGKIQAAKDAEGLAAKGRFDTELAEKEKIKTRRGEAVTEIASKLKVLKDGANGVATEIAGKMTDDQLKGDGYKTAIADVAARVGKCAHIGVLKKETLQEVAGMKTEEFDRLHSGWEEVHKAGGKGGAPLATPAAPGTEEKTGDGKPKMMF